MTEKEPGVFEKFIIGFSSSNRRSASELFRRAADSAEGGRLEEARTLTTQGTAFLTTAEGLSGLWPAIESELAKRGLEDPKLPPDQIASFLGLRDALAERGVSHLQEVVHPLVVTAPEKPKRPERIQPPTVILDISGKNLSVAGKTVDLSPQHMAIMRFLSGETRIGQPQSVHSISKATKVPVPSIYSAFSYLRRTGKLGPDLGGGHSGTGTQRIFCNGTSSDCGKN